MRAQEKRQTCLELHLSYLAAFRMLSKIEVAESQLQLNIYNSFFVHHAN